MAGVLMRRLGHKEVQGEGHVKEQGEDGHVQVDEKELRKNQLKIL